MTTSSPSSETRGFKVHPGIIKTLIREQAGSMPKAFSELIMNAVDAGATRIDLTIDRSGAFTLRDNGKGFKDRYELEAFWETFGTPHEENDAFYGRFRIGRGQIMSYASTQWRSGHFEMKVDLEREDETFGYEFTEHPTYQSGCTIVGRLYTKFAPYIEYNFNSLRTEFEPDECYSSETFEGAVRYVPVPIFINQIQVNTLPCDIEWDMEDDYAWYKFDRSREFLQIFNMGIYVDSIYAVRFGVGGVICTKKPLKLNLARNSVIEHECSNWLYIKEVMHNRFSQDLVGVKRLNQYEAAALLHNLSDSDEALAPQVRKRIQKLRFVPDIFGAVQSPDSMLSGDIFTLFDGKHTGIAERVQRHGFATVLMPIMFSQLQIGVSDANAVELLNRLRAKIYLENRGNFKFRPFEHFVNDLRDTSKILDDNDLSKEELLVLGLLRKVNSRVARMTNGPKASTRKIVAGEADCYNGWTDATSYIAIDREGLSGMRWEGVGPTRLVTLMIHEYSHLESSTGDHDHDFEFLNRFHEAIFHHDYGDIVNELLKSYVSGLCKLDIVPSAYTGAYVRKLAKLSEALPRRVKSKGSQEN